MKEADWQSCTDPQAMLEFLRDKASDRKLRLFACACARLVWDRLPAGCVRESVETAEKYADGLATDEDRDRYLELVRSQAWEALQRAAGEPSADVDALFSALQTVFSGFTYRDRVGGVDFTSSQLRTRPHHPGLLRDIFGPLPFRPVAIDPAWLRWNHGTVPAIAQRVYDERAYEDLPILADALEDAGCQDEDILGHCRGQGPHVRGCWVLDLVVGKE